MSKSDILTLMDLPHEVRFPFLQKVMEGVEVAYRYTWEGDPRKQRRLKQILPVLYVQHMHTMRENELCS